HTAAATSHYFGWDVFICAPFFCSSMWIHFVNVALLPTHAIRCSGELCCDRTQSESFLLVVTVQQTSNPSLHWNGCTGRKMKPVKPLKLLQLAVKLGF